MILIQVNHQWYPYNIPPKAQALKWKKRLTQKNIYVKDVNLAKLYYTDIQTHYLFNFNFHNHHSTTITKTLSPKSSLLFSSFPKYKITHTQPLSLLPSLSLCLSSPFPLSLERTVVLFYNTSYCIINWYIQLFTYADYYIYVYT